MTGLQTIADCALALQEGRTSALALTEAALERIGDPGGEGGRSFIGVYADAARAAARASDLLRAAGLSRSALDGVPVSIKNAFDVAGVATLAGSTVLKFASPAGTDAAAVRRLRQAGAVIVGTTNMTEFAYSGLGLNPHYGTPRNPWDRATGRIPGGSSSGAAVSVADGMAVVGVGTDTGGSVRIPAALCGLVGFKPTARRVPMDGMLPLSRQLDSVGPIASSVACCALCDAVLAGEPEALPEVAVLSGLRVTVPSTVVLDGLDAAVAAAFSGALEKLSAAGVRVRERPIPAFARFAGINAQGGLTAAEAWAWHRAMLPGAQALYDPRVVVRILRGREISSADLLDLLAARRAWIDEVEDSLVGEDAVVMPTVPLLAPPIAALEASDEAYFQANGAMLRNPSLINFLDGCALSLPCQAPGDAPVGLMLAGPAMSDRRILSIGRAVEACLRSA